MGGSDTSFVVEAGQHVARAGGGFGLALDLDARAACCDVDAEPVFDRDQVAVELPEQGAKQMGLFEFDLESGARPGSVCGFLLRH